MIDLGNGRFFDWRCGNGDDALLLRWSDIVSDH